MVLVQQPVRISAAQRKLLLAACRPVARGRAAPTDRQLAEELVVGEAAVERQMQRLMSLFGTSDRVELADRAIERGTVTRPELFRP